MRGDKRLRVPDDDLGNQGALNQIGARLEERRLELRLRMEMLCSRIEDLTGGRWRPTRQDIYRITQGTRSASELEVLALSAALDVDPIWLFVGDANATTYANELMEKWKAKPVATDAGDRLKEPVV